jgi:hypothetical protein
MKLNLVSHAKKGQYDLKVLNFLLNQLKYHREPVQNLLKESIRFSDISNENDSSYLMMWIQQLEAITEENIED